MKVSHMFCCYTKMFQTIKKCCMFFNIWKYSFLPNLLCLNVLFIIGLHKCFWLTFMREHLFQYYVFLEYILGTLKIKWRIKQNSFIPTLEFCLKLGISNFWYCIFYYCLQSCLLYQHNVVTVNVHGYFYWNWKYDENIKDRRRNSMFHMNAFGRDII